MTDGVELEFVPGRRKVYLECDAPNIQVPFTAVELGDSPGRSGGVANDAVLLYDTSVPGGDLERGPVAAPTGLSDRSPRC